jgi:hypothetical protein
MATFAVGRKSTPRQPMWFRSPMPAGAIVVAANAGSDYLFVPDGGIDSVKAAVTSLQSRLQFGAIFDDICRRAKDQGPHPRRQEHLLRSHQGHPRVIGDSISGGAPERAGRHSSAPHPHLARQRRMSDSGRTGGGSGTGIQHSPKLRELSCHYAPARPRFAGRAKASKRPDQRLATAAETQPWAFWRDHPGRSAATWC